MSSHPPCRILFRSKKGVELYSVSEQSSDNANNANEGDKCVTLATGFNTIHNFSPDGKKLAVHFPSVGVRLFDLSKSNTNAEAQSDSSSIILENTKGVQFMAFSSQGTYILTWERAAKVAVADGESTSTSTSTAPPNLKIWSSATGKFVHGFRMRMCSRKQWPPVKWSHDEKKAFHLVVNEIHVYDGHVFGQEDVKYNDKIRCQGVTIFSLPSSYTASTIAASSGTGMEGKYLMCTFVQETKGKPARVSFLRYPDKCGNTENPKSGAVLVSKSFYQAEDCAMKWSPKGDAALILTTTSVDTSGESYYGSTNLYLLLSEGKSSLEGDALSVPLPGSSTSSSGPVLDVAWMPNASKAPAFGVISGKMPAMASLHHGLTAEPTFLFGNAHRNTIVWSDHGRFLTIGGFGNLAGGMDFYDKNKLKKIPQFDPSNGAELGSNGNTAACAVGYGWSPSSRYFMVSTTTPRMNVDNGVALYKYNGLEIPEHDKSIISWDNAKFTPDQLLAAEFVPAANGVYPDRAQSPPPKRTEGEASAAPSSGGGGAAAAAAPSAYKPPAGRYVPPGAKKTGSGLSLSERMRKEREGSTVTAKKLFPNATFGGKKLPVGMAPPKAKSQNALKKERQKLAKQKAEQAEKEEKERLEREEKERLAAAAADPVKQGKKLNKILKQIATLKEKDPASLNDDQKKKLASEAETLEKLAQLNM
jgi:translation initiation factor 2A